MRQLHLGNPSALSAYRSVQKVGKDSSIDMRKGGLFRFDCTFYVQDDNAPCKGCHVRQSDELNVS